MVVDFSGCPGSSNGTWKRWDAAGVAPHGNRWTGGKRRSVSPAPAEAVPDEEWGKLPPIRVVHGRARCRRVQLRPSIDQFVGGTKRWGRTARGRREPPSLGSALVRSGNSSRPGRSFLRLRERTTACGALHRTRLRVQATFRAHADRQSCLVAFHVLRHSRLPRPSTPAKGPD